MKRDLRFLIVELGRRHSLLKEEIEVDFEKVSEKLMEKYHINLAASSLHRLLHAMKLKSIEKPKRKTLDRLSILAGFQNREERQRAFWGE